MNTRKAIPYGKGYVVDIYTPGVPGSVPVVVCVGAPGFHDHAGNVALAKAICEQGSLSVLSPSYQLGWVGEAFGALGGFIQTQAQSFGGDADRITVVGISSGAGPAAVWAFSDGLPGSASIVSSYVGAGGLYGAFLWPLIGRNTALRVRLVHGEQDEAAPVRSAVRLDEILRKAGYDCVLQVGSGTHPDTYDHGHPLGRITVATIISAAQGE